MLDEAHAPRPKPEPAAPWAGTDPATALVGPWNEPTSPSEALATLKRLVHLRSGRILALGQLCELVVYERLYLDLGYDDAAHFAREELGVSGRTLQRYRAAGRTADWYPQLVDAVHHGLHLDKAVLLATHQDTDLQVDRWLELAHALGARAFRQLARDTRLDGATRERLRHHLRTAEAHAATAEALPHGGPPAPLDPQATRTGSPATLALPPAPHEPHEPISRGWIRAHEHLLEAATWLVATLEPPTRGFPGKVKQQSRHTCQNPECGRQALSVEAHHVHWRSKGGPDHPDNGLALCRACHLRLVHSGHVTVKRVGSAHVWTYPGRVVVVPAVSARAAPSPKPRPPP